MADFAQQTKLLTAFCHSFKTTHSIIKIPFGFLERLLSVNRAKSDRAFSWQPGWNCFSFGVFIADSFLETTPAAALLQIGRRKSVVYF